MDQPAFFKEGQVVSQRSNRNFTYLLKLTKRELFSPVCQQQFEKRTLRLCERALKVCDI
jgi:hypothetical protein